MSASEIVNRAEIVLWSINGTAFLIVAIRATVRPAPWGEALLLAAAFYLFAASDWIEIGTGAWWKPWWLLVIKVCCLVVFGRALYRLWRHQNQLKSDSDQAETDN